MKKQTVNDRIKEVRLEVGLNPAEFATKAGLSVPAIYKIESQKVEPSEKTVRAISKTYGIDLLWLKEGEGAMPAVSNSIETDSTNPWKDEAYKALKEEVQYLRDMLKMAMGGKSANFHKALDFAGLNLSMLKRNNSSRAQAA